MLDRLIRIDSNSKRKHNQGTHNTVRDKFSIKLTNDLLIVDLALSQRVCQLNGYRNKVNKRLGQKEGVYVIKPTSRKNAWVKKNTPM